MLLASLWVLRGLGELAAFGPGAAAAVVFRRVRGAERSPGTVVAPPSGTSRGGRKVCGEEVRCR